MPCANRDHDHTPWPDEGSSEFVIEACENHCGWCDYRTKSANNLRVVSSFPWTTLLNPINQLKNNQHANRHLRNEETLRNIKIVKGSAGRKKLRMTKRRFITSEVCEENPNALNPDEEMKLDGCENSTVNYNFEFKNDSSSAFSPEGSDSSRRTLPVPRSTMENSTSMSEPSTGYHKVSSPLDLSQHARELCEKHIFDPLRKSIHTMSCVFPEDMDSDLMYGLISQCGSKIREREITCLRDLERTLLNGASTMSERDDPFKQFLRAVVNCITKSWFLYEERDQIRPGDVPYNVSYIENLWKSVLSGPRALVTLGKETVHEVSHNGGKEMRSNPTQQTSNPTETETGVQANSLHEGLGMEGSRRNQAAGTDRNVPKAFQHHTSNSSKVQRDFDSLRDQNHTQDNVNPSEEGNQADIAHYLWSSTPCPGFPSWTDLGYSECDVSAFTARLKKYLPNDSPNHSEQPALVRSGAARAKNQLSSLSINIIQKNILLPLLHKPASKSYKPLLLFCAGMVYTMQSLRDVEIFLFSAPESDEFTYLTYLAFTNALFAQLMRVLGVSSGGADIIPEEEKTRPLQPPYSRTYFTGLLSILHRHASKDGHNEREASSWMCSYDECCIHGEDVRQKEYLVIHLQHYHGEDIGVSSDEESAGFVIDALSWRCSNCLLNTWGWDNNWSCKSCKAMCEEHRIKARIKIRQYLDTLSSTF